MFRVDIDDSLPIDEQWELYKQLMSGVMHATTFEGVKIDVDPIHDTSAVGNREWRLRAGPTMKEFKENLLKNLSEAQLQKQ